MKGIQSLFLRAKHWQILVLFLVFWLFSYFVGDIYASIWLTSSGVIANTALLLSLLSIAPLWACYLLWFWSMGSFLVRLAGPSRRPSENLFWLSIVYPCFYLVVFTELVQFAHSWWVLLILPFHFFAIFCLLYIIYFVAKCLALAETGRKAVFSDYLVPLFLFWFFPVGIWFTQPRINRLYAKKQDIAASQEPVAG